MFLTPVLRLNCSEMCFLIGKTLVNITEAKYMDKPHHYNRSWKAECPGLLQQDQAGYLESSFGSLIGGLKLYWNMGSNKCLESGLRMS